MTIRHIVIAFLATLVVGLAGCGDDGGNFGLAPNPPGGGGGGGGGGGPPPPACSLAGPGMSATTATATVSWDPPTTLTDNVTPLTGVNALDSFKIYIGTASGVYTTILTVTDESLSSCDITNLDVGTAYFMAITAVTVQFFESAFSNEITFTL
jgi:hypothetical protein